MPHRFIPKGLIIGAGQTLTNAGDYSVSGNSLFTELQLSRVVLFMAAVLLLAMMLLYKDRYKLPKQVILAPLVFLLLELVNVSGATSFGDITGTISTLNVSGSGTVGGALTVTGDLTVNGTTTTIDTAVTAVDSLTVDGEVVVGAGISAVGNVTSGGTIAATGDVTSEENPCLNWKGNRYGDGFWLIAK